MGEIAEAMLDGTLCQYCGVWMGHRPNEPPPGFPMTCNACKQRQVGEDESEQRGRREATDER